MNSNERETGARKLVAVPRKDETDQNAALAKKPEKFGLSEPVDDVDEKTRHSDGQRPNTAPGAKSAGVDPFSPETDRTGRDDKR